MIAGIIHETKDISFLTPYWKVLKTWADYIVTSLPDPGNQLCTDDFEGKSPHNMNLAAKVCHWLGGRQTQLSCPTSLYFDMLYIGHGSTWSLFSITKAQR